MTTKTEVKPMAPPSSRLTPSGEETIMDLIVKLSGDESGASAVEYALLLAGIALAVITAVKTLGFGVRGWFDTANSQYPTAGPPPHSGG
jgi:pilus assembly protein Flp/PilA